MSNDCIPSQDQMRYRASIACLQGGCNIHVPERGEEFDRFIAKVKADAWDEAVCEAMRQGVIQVPVNPYRQEDER